MGGAILKDSNKINLLWYKTKTYEFRIKRRSFTPIIPLRHFLLSRNPFSIPGYPFFSTWVHFWFWVPFWDPFFSMMVPFWDPFFSTRVPFWYPFFSPRLPFWYPFLSTRISFWYPFFSTWVYFWWPFFYALIPFWWPFFNCLRVNMLELLCRLQLCYTVLWVYCSISFILLAREWGNNGTTLI